MVLVQDTLSECALQLYEVYLKYIQQFSSLQMYEVMLKCVEQSSSYRADTIL